MQERSYSHLHNLLNMSTMSFNYNQKDKKSIFTTASDTMATTTTVSFVF